MPISKPLREGLIACVLLSTALSSVALTLGRSRGVALVGRTLDVAIQVTLDTPGQAADLCPEADVFHGDSRVDGSRVTARLEPGSGQNAVVRVRSTAAVDEPVVTIYLRLGCTQKITRRYVLLAEEPGEFVPPAAAVQPAPAPTAPRAPVAAPVPAPAPAPMLRDSTEAAAAAAVSRAEAAAQRRAAARTRRAAEAAAPAPARTQAVVRAAPRASRSRLTVDMLDLTPERTPQLRSSSALAGTPSSDEQVRIQAAALWRAINAQPEDVLRDLQRVQALETDLKGLRALVAGNDRSLNEVRAQLNQARQERTLTLAVIALLALLLAAMVVTWWLRRGERTGAGDWWRRDAAAAAAAGAGGPRSPASGPEQMDLRVDESMFESLKHVARRGPVVVTAPARSPARPVAPVPADSVSGPASSFNGSLQSGFQSSQVASMRMVKAEELVDIQQQADFFMSLGQTEQAIEVLASHIHNNTETSALVWLDLLAIYRSLKRRDDYERLRAEFQRVFNAQVPAYDSTPTVSGGLEDYPRALTRIAALWPSPKVMDVIEESIFRKPGMAGAEPFDLEAYRELVMLYNLGREVVQPESAPVEDWSLSGSGNKSPFSETSMQPLSVARYRSAPEPEDSDLGSDLDSGRDAQTSLGEMLELDSFIDGDASPVTTGDEFLDPQVPRPSPRLGLDIDLTAPAPAPRAPLDSNSIDFELFEPDDEDEGKSGPPGRAA